MSEIAMETRVSLLENDMEDAKEKIECIETEQKTGYATLSKQFVDFQIEMLKKINGLVIKMAIVLGGSTISLAVFIYLTAHKP